MAELSLAFICRFSSVYTYDSTRLGGGRALHPSTAVLGMGYACLRYTAWW